MVYLGQDFDNFGAMIFNERVQSWVKYMVSLSVSSDFVWTPRFLSWSFQVLLGPSRYWIESSICDNRKHKKRFLEILLFLECSCHVVYSHTSNGSWGGRLPIDVHPFNGWLLPNCRVTFQWVVSTKLKRAIKDVYERFWQQCYYSTSWNLMYDKQNLTWQMAL